VSERWEFSALDRLLREGTDDDIHRFFLLLRPPELADLLETLGESERKRALGLMSAPLASDVIPEVEEDTREEIMEDLSSSEIAEIVPHMLSDDAADVIGALPPEKAERTLGQLDEEEREEIEELLEYGEETAGGIMQTEVVTAGPDMTVREAMEAVRGTDVEDVGEIHEVFVVDKDRRLVGSISPADLLQEEPNQRLREVMDRNPVQVPVTLDQEEIARKVREHDLAAIPVVDQQGRLVGQVLHDDIADVMQREATEDIAKMAGTDPDEMYEDRVAVAVRMRATWLVPAFGGGLMVVVLLSMAEKSLKEAPWLLTFLPVILGMAGNVGTQTSALTVRGLALGRIQWGRVGKVILRQVVTGLCLGVLFGLLLFGFALLKGWDRGDIAVGRYALTVAFAIFGAMTMGATMGVSVPALIDRLGHDPAIASSPFVQTANDLTGTGILLLVAHWMGLLG